MWRSWVTRAGVRTPRRSAADFERVAQLLDRDPHLVEPFGHVHRARRVQRLAQPPAAARDAARRPRAGRVPWRRPARGRRAPSSAASSVAAAARRQRRPQPALRRGTAVRQRAAHRGARRRHRGRAPRPALEEPDRHVELAHRTERPGDPPHLDLGPLGGVVPAARRASAAAPRAAAARRRAHWCTAPTSPARAAGSISSSAAMRGASSVSFNEARAILCGVRRRRAPRRRSL